MNKPSLKHSLALWISELAIEGSFAPRKTWDVAANVKKTFGSFQPRTPEPYDLRELHRRVEKHWHREHTLNRLNPRDLRRLPWILFYPADIGNRRGNGSVPRFDPQGRTISLVADSEEACSGWLGQETAIVRDYGHWLSTGPCGRSVLALIHEFLRVYPTNLTTFNQLRRLLKDTLNGDSSPPIASLQRWRDHCQNSWLLEEGGALAFVQDLMFVEEPVDEVLDEAGLDGILSRCAFLRSGLLAYLPQVGSLLRGVSLEVAYMDRLLTLLTFESRLRFGDRYIRSGLTLALLSPFEKRRPQSAIRDRLQAFFLRHFGDPRLRKHRWFGIPMQQRQILIRWLTERDLEQFLMLVKESALDSHWRYREAFWQAFLDRNLIDDIWFVLGSWAKDQLQRISKRRGTTETTADLRGAEGNQSVLLMRMPGVTVAEWSHNGSCRFWLDGNDAAPKLFKRVYHRVDVTRAADFVQGHHGSPQGRWQDHIVDWLRHNTGILVDRGDYFPARLREHGRDRPVYWEDLQR